MMRHTAPTRLCQIGDREVRAVVSSSLPGRDNLVVDVAGIDLSQYKRNPTVLWMHDPLTPIARCIGAAAFRRRVSLSRHYHRQDARGSLSAGRLSLFFEQGGSAARSKQITNDNSEQQQQRNAPEHQRRSPRLQRALRDKE